MSHAIYVVSKSRGFKRQILQLELPAPPPPPRPLLRPSVPPKARAHGQQGRGNVRAPRYAAKHYTITSKRTLKDLGPPRPAMPVGLVRAPRLGFCKGPPTARKSKGVQSADDSATVPTSPTDTDTVPTSPRYIPPSPTSAEDDFGPCQASPFYLPPSPEASPIVFEEDGH